MPAFGGHKLRHDDGDGFIGLTMVNDIFKIDQERLNKKTEGRIKDDETSPIAPGLPFFLDSFRFRRVERYVDSRHIIRKKFCIMQGLQCTLMHAAEWHDHPMP